MSAAHQRFSAQTRQAGELDRPAGGRRRNLDTGRLSVVLGADPCVVLEDLAAQDQRSTGGYIRKIVTEYLAKLGLEGDTLATRAAQLRAAKAASDPQSDEQPDPATATPAAV